MRRFMTRLGKSFRYGEKGFTLIELLVVIAILGALVAIAVPAVAGFIGSGEDEAWEAELYNVITATTAALVKSSTPGTIVAVGTSAAKIQLVPTVSAGAGDPREYLLNATQWKYFIDTDGTVEQSAVGDKA